MPSKVRFCWHHWPCQNITAEAIWWFLLITISTCCPSPIHTKSHTRACAQLLRRQNQVRAFPNWPNVMRTVTLLFLHTSKWSLISEPTRKHMKKEEKCVHCFVALGEIPAIVFSLIRSSRKGTAFADLGYCCLASARMFYPTTRQDRLCPNSLGSPWHHTAIDHGPSKSRVRISLARLYYPCRCTSFRKFRA